MQEAIEHLKKQDKTIAKIIEKIGPLKHRKKTNYYASLCQAIIFQQLSMKSASKIYYKFKKIHEHKINPKKTISLGKEKLEKIGLSEKKAEYIIGLAKAISENTIDFKAMQKMSDEEITNELIKHKGIGPWTAQMFLIFSLGRKNVLPSTDLGFINAMQKAYCLKEKPNKEQIEKIAKKWEPYKTIASLYIWASTDKGVEY